MTTAWEQVRAVADTVLYEGTCSTRTGRHPGKPVPLAVRRAQATGAAEAGVGEEATLAAGFLIEDGRTLTLIVRFLQLQRRRVLRGDPRLGLVPVEELVTPPAPG